MYYYSSIVLLAASILMIENHDILFGGDDSQNSLAKKQYKQFLYVVLAYYATDALWGFFDSLHLVSWLFADTLIYFIALAAGVLFWTQFVVAYLAEENTFSRFLSHAGLIFFASVWAILVLNCFIPILFWFDNDGTYHANVARYALLLIQILLFLLASLYALRAMTQAKGALRKRYRTVCLFGLTMALSLSIQWNYPLLPLYTVGYLLGTSLLHSFVVIDARDEYKQELLESLQREQAQHKELKSAWRLAHTDSLTGIHNKMAYVEAAEKKDRQIAAQTSPHFAVAVFDVNDLKVINDKMGHEMGDQYIMRASRMICDHFNHSLVFRIGGDEFAALLEGTDFENRFALHDSFDRMMDEANRQKDALVVSMGMSEYDEAEDDAFHRVFARADHEMYLRKQKLKHLAQK